MKRNLKDNLCMCLIGFVLFFTGNMGYTFVKQVLAIDMPAIYFIPLAASYVFISLGLLRIANQHRILKNLFAMFLFLSISNLFDELLFVATKFDIREYWYSAVIIGYFTAKIINISREHN